MSESIESKQTVEPGKGKEELPRKNPNNIGALFSVGKDIMTFPDKVYRSVKGDAAIKDLFEGGVVRN